MAQTNLIPQRLLIMGGSAGSLEVVMKIVMALPVPLFVPVVIVVHRRGGTDSILADLLAAKTALTVKDVEDKDPLEAGVVYLAPPDYHLLFEKDGTLSLDASEKVHYSRPSIDVSFFSAAEVFGAAVLGILLSGANADGAEGLNAIQQAGGLSIVQNPESAEVYYMPAQAIALNPHHRVLPPEQMPAVIQTWLNAGAGADKKR